MPRAPKKGLDFYPKEVDFWDDFKIMDLVDRYGPMGFAVYDVTVCLVYKAGYYLEATMPRLCSLIIRKIGNRWVRTKEDVEKILLYCGELGLLDKKLLSEGIVTSLGIQRRYAGITARTRADRSHYWLLKDDAPEKTALPEPDTKTADPRPTDDFPEEDLPHPAEYIPEEDPRPAEYIPTEDPRPTEYIPTEDPRPAEYFPEEDLPHPTDDFPTEDPRPAEYFSTEDPHPAEYFPEEDLHPADDFPKDDLPHPAEYFPEEDLPRPAEYFPLENLPHPAEYFPEEDLPHPADFYPDTPFVVENSHDLQTDESSPKTRESPGKTQEYAAEMQQKKKKEKKRKENGKESVCVQRLLFDGGELAVTRELLEEYTHTYPRMKVEESLKKLASYLKAHPKRCRTADRMKGYVELWLSEDDRQGKYRQPELTAPTYDLAEYESYSVADQFFPEDEFNEESGIPRRSLSDV